jgi:hypothetical protein
MCVKMGRRVGMPWRCTGAELSEGLPSSCSGASECREGEGVCVGLLERTTGGGYARKHPRLAKGGQEGSIFSECL